MTWVVSQPEENILYIKHIFLGSDIYNLTKHITGDHQRNVPEGPILFRLLMLPFSLSDFLTKQLGSELNVFQWFDQNICLNEHI